MLLAPLPCEEPSPILRPLVTTSAAHPQSHISIADLKLQTGRFLQLFPKSTFAPVHQLLNLTASGAASDGNATSVASRYTDICNRSWAVRDDSWSPISLDQGATVVRRAFQIGPWVPNEAAGGVFTVSSSSKCVRSKFERPMAHVLASGVGIPEEKWRINWPLALIVTGHGQDVDTNSWLLGRKAMPDFAKRMQAHLFLSMVQKRESQLSEAGSLKNSPYKNTTSPTDKLMSLVRAWQPIAWHVADMDLGGVGANPCTQSHQSVGARVCEYTSERAPQGRLQGCFEDGGRACSHCDMRNFWPQFGRLRLAFEEVVRYEKERGTRYKWLARVRMDFHGFPSQSDWPDHFEWRAYATAAVHLHQLAAHTTPADSHSWVPVDWFAFVPRALGERFFSVGFNFLACQQRRSNDPWCQVTNVSWDAGEHGAWPMPQCVFKRHMIACAGPRVVLGLPWRPGNQINLTQ